MAKDYSIDAIARLTGQFANSPLLQQMLAAIVGPLTDLEDHCDDLTTDRWIDSAAGVQLDGCGYIVGVSRRGRNDDDYRAAIKYRVFVNVSTATPGDLLKGLQYLTKPTDMQYLEAHPATVLLWTNGHVIPPPIAATWRSSILWRSSTTWRGYGDDPMTESVPPRDIAVQMQDLAPAAISDVPVVVSYWYGPEAFRFSKAPTLIQSGDFFVAVGGVDYYLEVTDAGGVGGLSDLIISVNQSSNQTKDSPTLGGAIPADLFVSDQYLEMADGSILAVYDPNNVITLGNHNLQGVFQA